MADNGIILQKGRTMVRKSLSATFALVVTLAFAGSTAFAQQTKTLNAGITSVALSSTFVDALTSLNVTPGTVAPTELEHGKASFPVIGGALDLDSAKGNILHSGGLTLNAGNTHVALQSFIIDTTNIAKPVITGLVSANGKLIHRIPLFDIALPQNLTTPLHPEGWILQVKGVELTLDSAAAADLTTVFKTNVPAGLPIGTANVTIFLHNHDWGQDVSGDWRDDN